MTQRTKALTLEEVLGRALRDREFRQKLTADPRTLAVEAPATIAAGILCIGAVGKRNS